MFTPWRSATAYAAVITAGSFAVGTVITVGYSLAAGSWEDWENSLLFTRYHAIFLAAVFTVLAVARRVCAPLPRWRAAVVDSGLYTLVMLVVSVITSIAEGVGVGEAVDWAFVEMTFALLTLQIPTAYVLSWWASERLTLAVHVPRRPSDPTARFEG